jgi:hypothetical protein
MTFNDDAFRVQQKWHGTRRGAAGRSQEARRMCRIAADAAVSAAIARNVSISERIARVQSMLPGILSL